MVVGYTNNTINSYTVQGNESVTVESSNTSVATVQYDTNDGSIDVTAVGSGLATITVKVFLNGNVVKKGTFNVGVS